MLNHAVNKWCTNLVTKSYWYQNVVTIAFFALLVFGMVGLPKFASSSNVSDYLLPNSECALYLRTAKHEGLSGVDPPLLQIFVNNVPNLTIEGNREKLEDLVREYERSQYTFSDIGTSFWMREYLKFLGVVEKNSKEHWNDQLKRWSGMNHIVKPFGASLIFRKATKSERAVCGCEVILDKCKFSLSINSKYLIDRPEAAKAMVEIAEQKRFSELNVVLVPPGIGESEQLLTAADVNLKSMIFCTCAVALLGVLFVTDWHAAAWLLVMIASINIVNIGLMGWLGIPLNLVTMLVLFTGVGISVDYSIHICSAFARNDKPDACEKLNAAIKEVGVPVLQCGITTVTGILALHGIQVPMFANFYHTMLLVVIVGFVHAMVFLPVLLMRSVEIKRWLLSAKRGRCGTMSKN